MNTLLLKIKNQGHIIERYNEIVWSDVYQKIEHKVIQGMVWLLVFNILGSAYIFQKFFLSDVITPVQASTPLTPSVYRNIEVKSGPATSALVADLKDIGLDPKVRYKVTRPLFETSEAYLVTLNGDNFEVFEYADHQTTSEKITFITQEYKDSAWPDVYKNQIHLYVKDNVGIYYMGSDEGVLDILDENADMIFRVGGERKKSDVPKVEAAESSSVIESSIES